MRAVYAAHLETAPGTDAEDVVRIAAAWPCRGQAPSECASWEPGRRTFELPVEGHTLDVEVFLAAEGRLWQATWRHPHADDPKLHLVNEIAVGELDGAVTASLVIRTVWAQAQVTVPRFTMRAPRLVRDLLDQVEVNDAGRRLSREPQRLDAADADAFVDEVLLNQERTRPVVFVSDDPRVMRPLVDPAPLGRELAGLAHVFYSVYAHPAARLSHRLGNLGCRNGAMRIWWPGLTLDDDPYRHRLYLPRSLRDWEGPSPTESVFRLVSVAAATNAEPVANATIRAAARRAQLAATTDLEELTQLAEDALSEADALREQLAAAEDAAELAHLERDQALSDIEELREEKRRVEKTMADVRTYVGREREDVGPEPAAEVPGSVLDAAEAAEPQCPHLVFCDRAFESAAESPYEFPEDVLEDLLKLERLGALWARPEGIGGIDLGQKARELGLDWKADVSTTTTGGTRARQYEFTWNGERLRMGPHVRRNRGNGAGRIARIYLYKHEPNDPEERRLVVAHVGRKLDDSTTG